MSNNLRINNSKDDGNSTNISDEERIIQYAARGGAYIRCGATRKKMEPGFYSVVDAGNQNYGLKPKVCVHDELIDLPGTVADDIFLDIDKFLQTAPRYSAFNLTHKRGYLFYGPPGSGKTSLGLMLANRFINNVGGVVMYIGGVGEFYHGVELMRDVEPGRPSMYLIEEADTIVNNTLCLGILDGELSIAGAVFVAMTNYKKRLPPRIANRPGRFDRVTFVDCPPEPVQIEYLRRVAARSPEDTSTFADAPVNIVKALSGLHVSMAHLREAFISHVLMGVSLHDLRVRFEIMAGVHVSDQLLRAPSFIPPAPAVEIIHDEGDEPDDDELDDDDFEDDLEDEDERRNARYDAKRWLPGNGI